jgi:hypothetical protein
MLPHREACLRSPALLPSSCSCELALVLNVFASPSGSRARSPILIQLILQNLELTWWSALRIVLTVVYVARYPLSLSLIADNSCHATWYVTV